MAGRSGPRSIFSRSPRLGTIGAAGALLAGLMLLSAIGSAQPAADGSLALLVDPDFRRGLLGRDRNSQSVVIRWRDDGAPAVWQVAQHHSQSNVTDQTFQTIRERSFTFKDRNQWLAMPAPEHGADVVLGVNAANEFSGKPRAKGDPWPHLFLSQRISPPGGHLGPSAPSLAEMERVDFGIRVRLLYDRRPEGVRPDPAIHAAQFLFFLTVQNLNRASPGFGDYYWFGILLYDDRHPVTSLRVQRDAGSAKKPATGKMIYNIGVKPFTEQVVAAGEWVEVSGDLRPHLVAGLEEAWRQGYLSGSRALGDYRLGGAVLGWEITGLNDAAMAVRELRCVAQKRR